MKKLLTITAIAAFTATGALADDHHANDQCPDGRGNLPQNSLPQFARPSVQPTVSGNGINYHGGAVLTAPVKAYLIWYGNWSGNTATTIIPNLVNGLSASPYFNINTTYTNSANAPATNAVSVAGQTTDTGSQGASLSDSQIQTIVATAINAGKLPKDTTGVYFVLTSADVNERSGFCTQYCGWHTRGTIGGSDIKYAFIGNPARCPSSCAAQSASSPNGNVGADGMASILTHELEEAVTDPDLNAWYDSRGEENADKCAWTFGTTSTAANGSKYNVTLGGMQFLIQQNWVNAVSPTGAKGYCAMKYPN